MILGIDIGGANTKIATGDGGIREIYYLPLWKGTGLVQTLTQIAGELRPSKVAVVMTGELADCFPDKRSGVRHIKDAVELAFKDSIINYVDVKGELTGGGDELGLAAANWCASARFIAQEFDDCVFADMGSTTTDIIPIANGVSLAHTTDFKRLLSGELVYTGVLRTNVAALTGSVQVRGRRCGLSSEYFANTADIHYILGRISEEEYVCETADGAGKDLLSSKRRLARTVCADLMEITDEELVDIAGQFCQAQLMQVREALVGTAQKHGVEDVVACGIGEFVIKEALAGTGLGVTLVSEKYGRGISSVFPAYAAAKLMEKL